VNTVSPTYAREALTPELGMGLDGALRAKGDRFFGILNGLDNAVWDPANDPALAAPFSREDRSGKAACRADLLTRNGMDPADTGPVIGMIGRLDPQKGFDCWRRRTGTARNAAPGSSSRVRATRPSRTRSASSPARRRARSRSSSAFDRDMARRIYAGSDFFAMPSRFEPSGQGQMIAMRYGTPPIVRHTGGLADTVVDVTRQPGSGTGFVFEATTPPALLGACDRAFALRDDGGSGLGSLVDRVMTVDFDWSTGPRHDMSRRIAAPSRSVVRGPRRSLTTARAARQPPSLEGAFAGRVRAAHDRDHAVIADDLGERPSGSILDVATGRRVATDDPDIDAGRGGIAQVCQATVPVAVVHEDRARRLEVELEEGLGLGHHVTLLPRGLRGSHRGDRLVQRGGRLLPGSDASREIRANDSTGDPAGSASADGSRPPAGRRWSSHPSYAR
jgi:hypothetical protein